MNCKILEINPRNVQRQIYPCACSLSNSFRYVYSSSSFPSLRQTTITFHFFPYSSSFRFNLRQNFIILRLILHSNYIRILLRRTSSSSLNPPLELPLFLQHSSFRSPTLFSLAIFLIIFSLFFNFYSFVLKITEKT